MPFAIRKSKCSARSPFVGSRTITASAAIVLVYLVTAATATASAANAAQVLRPLSTSNYSTQRVCSAASRGMAACFAQLLVPKTAAARARKTPLGMTVRPSMNASGPAQEGAFGLRPSDIHAAYGLPTEATSAQTIALVDAYDDPNAEEDLRVYGEEFGLPPCTTANGCFTKLNQDGSSSPLPETEEGWALEISLDIETAHAVCQTCHIMLVEANSSYLSDLETAEQTAVSHGATEVSNSYGGGDTYETGAYDHPGVVITASSGDSGYQEPAAYPASSPNVVAVGGTTLGLEEGRWAWERAWSGGGSGCNPLATAQPWQQSVADWSQVGCGSGRSVSDVAADADPNTGVAVFDTTGYWGSGWLTVGGTSLSSPLVAATFALAGGSNGVAYPASTLYTHLGENSLHDIVEGSNGACEEKLICNAGKGYDGPTGVGTPNGILAFVPTEKTPPPAVAGLTPAEGTTAGGTSVTITGTNLAAARAVDFGGTPATITLDSGTSITAISPAHAAGVANVTVTGFSGATSAESNAGRFDFVLPAPTVTGVRPNEGTTSGGTSITVTGSNALTISNMRWTPWMITAGHSPKLHVTLSEAATVSISINERELGRMVHGSCIPAKRSHRSCTASVHRLTVRLRAVAGNNVLAVPLGRLPVGRYVAAITARAANSRSPEAVTVSFGIRKRGPRG